MKQKQISKELTITLTFGLGTFVRLNVLNTNGKRGIAGFTNHISIINFETTKLFTISFR